MNEMIRKELMIALAVFATACAQTPGRVGATAIRIALTKACHIIGLRYRIPLLGGEFVIGCFSFVRTALLLARLRVWVVLSLAAVCSAQWPAPKSAMDAYEFVQNRRREAGKLWQQKDPRGFSILNDA